MLGGGVHLNFARLQCPQWRFTNVAESNRNQESEAAVQVSRKTQKNVFEPELTQVTRGPPDHGALLGAMEQADQRACAAGQAARGPRLEKKSRIHRVAPGLPPI